MNKVLILGGTGVMGTYLEEMFLRDGIDTYVTSRSKHTSFGCIHYIEGNAMDDAFLSSVVGRCRWDAIIDFMSYKTDKFRSRVDLLLNNTEQYIFISTARVYGDEEHPIKESSPRLLESSSDEFYLRTDEYALTKARQENLLLHSSCHNYTIVRPCITYGNNRLQLGVMEKQEWLYRALHGRTVVFCEEIAGRITTMTYGADVAAAIYSLIGNKDAVGETIHITCKHHRTWKEIMSIYDKSLRQLAGVELKVKMVPLEDFLSCRGDNLRYQVIYDRVYDRDYNTDKLSKFIDVDAFVKPEVGLPRCICEFLKNYPPPIKFWPHKRVA